MIEWSKAEEIIGYRFKDILLLETAFTHSSYANDYLGDYRISNERLEFLGDAILDMVVGAELYMRFPDQQEGFLSKLRAEIVCEETLACAAKELKLYEFLKLGRGEEANGGRTRNSILSDMVEAVIASVYVDGGIEASMRVVHNIMDSYIDKGCAGLLPKDSKTLLQEYFQKQGGELPVYKMISSEGPDHDKTFVYGVYLKGVELGRGVGKSKKEAESKAAKAVLEK